MKIRMYPHLDDFDNFASGIAQVVKHYFRYLPEYGVELVDRDATTYDLEAGHAGARPGAEVSHSHGLLWTAEFRLNESSWRDNIDLVHAARAAKEITVPSNWVAEPFKRDMRISPHVIWHGVEWGEWQEVVDNQGYVLWAKNRRTDGLDPAVINDIAKVFPDTTFYTTFSSGAAPMNVQSLQGAIPHQDMKLLIQGAGVILMSDRETWGILAAEAMACGVPVLSVDAGAVPEFMPHGIAGYCYRQGNLQDAVNGLAYCLSYRDRLGANGRELAKSLTWQKACEKVAGVYELALKEQDPTVSIVIPCYNCGATLQEAIESAVNQDYPGLTDIIIVDDGSTDDSVRSIAEAWSARDQRVRYQWQQNASVAAARNAGAGLSLSKYLCFLDADDKIEPGFIHKLVHQMEADRRLGIAYTGVKVHFPDGTELLPWDWDKAQMAPGQQRHSRMWPREWMYDLQVQGHNQIPTCCLIRRKAFDHMGGYRSRYCPEGAGSEDAELFLRLGAYGWGAQYVPPTQGTCWIHAHGLGNVSGDKEYQEPDWTAWHPWVKDLGHPFASYATPEHISHPIRSYEKPIVSVIIPVGPGHEKQVVNALDSLESQTTRYWEVLVVWDSIEPATPIMNAYPYAKVWFGPNLGAGRARNRGVERAKAPFIAFLDADDYYAPEFLEKSLAAFEDTGAVIYSDFMSKMTEEMHEKYGGNIIRRYHRTGEVIVDDTFDDFDKNMAMLRPTGTRPYVWSGITILLPKLWHEAIGGFDESMDTWEDCDYLLRLAWAGYDFYKLPERLWLYNFNTGYRRERQVDREAELVDYLAKKWDDSVKKWDVTVEAKVTA